MRLVHRPPSPSVSSLAEFIRYGFNNSAIVGSSVPVLLISLCTGLDDITCDSVAKSRFASHGSVPAL